MIFITSFIVLPAFYRDINLQSVGEGRPSLHEINVGSEQTNGSSYSKLLRLVTTLRASQGFAFDDSQQLSFVEELIQRTCQGSY